MNVASSTMPVRSVWLPRIGWAFMFVGALFAAGNAILFMTVDGFGGPDLKTRFLGEPLIGWAHTMGGAVAVLIGPFQFLSVVRNRFRRVHVWMGRVYLTAVLAGGLAGLYFAPTSLGGPITAIGFTLLAIIWLYTGSMAYLAIRRRDLAVHRRWMIRNYALTFAAVTLRIELFALIAAGVPFAYKTVAWSSWLPNLLVVEGWIRRELKAVGSRPTG